MATESKIAFGIPDSALNREGGHGTLRSPGLFARRPVLGITMMILGILAFGVLAYQITTGGPAVGWDRTAARVFHVESLNIPWSLIEYILFGFFVGREIVIILGALLAAYFLHQRLWREFGMLVIGLCGGMLIWYLLSHYMDRPGPVTQLDVLPAIGPSFPSGSALAAVLCYGLLAYLVAPQLPSRFWRRMAVILFLLIIAFIGFSSILLGTHYVTDVIAGYALGLAWAGVVYTLVERALERDVSRSQRSLSAVHPSRGLRTPGLFGKRPVLGLALVLLGSLIFGALVYSLLANTSLVQLDLALHRELLAKARTAAPAVDEIMLFGFFAGKQVILTIVTILSIYFFYKRYWVELAMLLFSSAAGSIVWNFVIQYFARPRPSDQTGLAVTTIPSFPSGHAMSAVICFGFLAYLLVPRMPTPFWKWTVGLGAVLIILFNGFSRMFHGGHYLTDVLGGYALGLAWAGLVYLGIEVIFLRRKV